MRPLRRTKLALEPGSDQRAAVRAPDFGAGPGGLVAQTATPYATAHCATDDRFRHTVDEVVLSAKMPAVAKSPSGFEYRVAGDQVLISHHGRRATTLRGAAGKRFLVDVENEDPQELMARLTGNYKHGNERTAGNHPRNMGR